MQSFNFHLNSEKNMEMPEEIRVFFLVFKCFLAWELVSKIVYYTLLY